MIVRTRSHSMQTSGINIHNVARPGTSAIANYAIAFGDLLLVARVGLMLGNRVNSLSACPVSRIVTVRGDVRLSCYLHAPCFQTARKCNIAIIARVFPAYTIIPPVASIRCA